MKNRTWLVLGVLTLGLVQHAPALDFQLGPYGSYYTVDDADDEAWGGGLMGRLGIADWLAVDARASYLDFQDIDLSLMPVEVAATLRLPLFENRLVPYGGVGVGYYFWDAGSDFDDVDDDVGFFPLAGLEFRFGESNQWSLFAEARWLFISSDLDAAGDEIGNLDDADLDGLAVNVGLLYRF